MKMFIPVKKFEMSWKAQLFEYKRRIKGRHWGCTYCTPKNWFGRIKCLKNHIGTKNQKKSENVPMNPNIATELLSDNNTVTP